MTLNYFLPMLPKNKMTHYDSNKIQIRDELSKMEDNIDRIQARLQCVSIAEFAKSIDFVNSELQTIHRSIDKLTEQCREFEASTRSLIRTMASAHNKLVEKVVEAATQNIGIQDCTIDIQETSNVDRL
jgi:CII-binding regulator of phage lambda lysogenization HflD